MSPSRHHQRDQKGKILPHPTTHSSPKKIPSIHQIDFPSLTLSTEMLGVVRHHWSTIRTRVSRGPLQCRYDYRLTTLDTTVLEPPLKTNGMATIRKTTPCHEPTHGVGRYRCQERLHTSGDPIQVVVVERWLLLALVVRVVHEDHSVGHPSLVDAVRWNNGRRMVVGTGRLYPTQTGETSFQETKRHRGWSTSAVEGRSRRSVEFEKGQRRYDLSAHDDRRRKWPGVFL